MGMISFDFVGCGRCLALAMLVGCASEDETPPASGSSGDATTGDASSSGQPTSGSGTSTTPTETGTTTTDPSDTGSDGGSESGAETGSGTGAIDCEARCAAQGACGELVEENCLANCVDTQAAADAVGEACGDAYVEFQDCQTQRTCEQIEQETGCEAEVEGVMLACAALAPDACHAVCPKWMECGLWRDSEDFCLGTCALFVGFAAAMGPECGAAHEAVYACEAELECAELDVDHCQAEQAAAAKICE
jgi:hypothetical protein